MQTADKLSNVQAIKKFFELDGRKVEMKELQELNAQDREALGAMCRAALAEEK